MWIHYTAYNKEGTPFTDTQVWIATGRRLKMALHAFEVETRLRFEQIERLMHPLAGYKPEQVTRARDKELERRNEKLAPLGSIVKEGSAYKLKRSFLWRDYVRVTNNDN